MEILSILFLTDIGLMATKLFYNLIDKRGVKTCLDYFSDIAIRTGTFAERAEAAYLDLPILNDVPLQDEFDTVMEDMAKNKILKKAQKYARRLGVSPGEHEIDFIGEIFVNGRPIMFDDVRER